MFSWAFFLPLFFFQASASLPSQFLIEQIASKRNHLARIVIPMEIVRLKDSTPTSVKIRETIDFNLLESVMVVKNSTVDGDVVYQRSIPIVEGGTEELSVHRLLVSTKQASILTKLLKDRGLPVPTQEAIQALETEAERRGLEQVRLTRWNRKPTWVIGDLSQQSTQLWIQKGSFFPVRWTWKKEGGDWYEVQFNQERSDQGLLHPTQMIFLKNGQARMMATIIGSEIQTFTEKSLRKKKKRIPFVLPESNGPTEAMNRLSSSEKALLEEVISEFR